MRDVGTYRSGASVVSTHRRMRHNERIYPHPHHRPHIRVGAFSAMWISPVQWIPSVPAPVRFPAMQEVSRDA